MCVHVCVCVGKSDYYLANITAILKENKLYRENYKGKTEN